MEKQVEHSNPLDSAFDPLRLSPIVGINVRMLREKQGFNKTVFSNMARISRPTLDKIESGKANPQLSVLVKLADALGTTPGRLLTTDSPRPDIVIDPQRGRIKPDQSHSYLLEFD